MKTITEIRYAIDVCDKQLINTLAERSALVKQAAAFKKNINEVKAPDRVRGVIESRCKWAVEAGLDADFIEQLYRSIINHFIAEESVLWNKGQYIISEALENDLPEILELQYMAYQQEARIYNNFEIQPLKQTLPEIKNEFLSSIILKMTKDSKIIGSVRAYEKDSTCYIGKVIVHPEFQGQGLGKTLLQAIENRFSIVCRYELFTGQKSTRNIAIYVKCGYKYFKDEVVDDGMTMVFMEKMRC